MINSLFMKMIDDPQKRVIMVIGASDSGKTSIVWSIARSLCERYKTAIVDLDMGQSHIGPPTTIAWAMMEKQIADWSVMEMRDFYFVGSVTPFGNLLPAITGARLITEKALNSAEKVVIDTTGLISEPVGRILKHHKIDILEPDIILAVQTSQELSRIIDPLRFNERPEIIRIPVPSGVRIKTQVKRAGYRVERMMCYLKEAEIISLRDDRVCTRFTRNPLRSKGEFINRVVSMRNSLNKDIAIGIIKDMTLGNINILTPLKDLRDVSSIVIGKTLFNMEEKTIKDL